MKVKLTLVALCLSLALLAGCGAPMHTITTSSGKQYVATDKLKYDEDSKTYTFTDIDGNTVILNQSDVLEIKAHDK